jgi:hypothetical protein
MKMTIEDIKEYKRNAIKILEDNAQYATAKAVDLAFNALICADQLMWERDVAIGQLEELGIGFGQKIEYANVVPREQYENLREAFVDYVCSGISNQAPYCKNSCDECVDERGWCTYRRCRGFNPDGRKYE